MNNIKRQIIAINNHVLSGNPLDHDLGRTNFEIIGAVATPRGLGIISAAAA